MYIDMNAFPYPASSSRLVCYYNSLAEERAADGKFTVSDIDPYKCTHLIYAFSDINTDNELVPTSAADIPRYHSFNELKTRSDLWISIIFAFLKTAWLCVIGCSNP